MKKIIMIGLAVFTLMTTVRAQEEEERRKDEEPVKGFNKENLFTGGSISVGFSNSSFLIGGSPVFGYSLTNWADAGIVINYNYTSFRDYGFIYNDKLRQTVYGGGPFLKLYPIRFLFVQGQYEHNFIRQKFIPNAGPTEKYTSESNSLLLGAGYTTGRQGKGGPPFFYISVLFDVLSDINSPYTDGYGRIVPIVRGGIQVPLFQGGDGRRDRRYR